MGALQNPDDFICRPTRFQKFESDGSITKTFGVYAAWPKSVLMGEINVRLTLDGAIHLSVTLEDGWQDEK